MKKIVWALAGLLALACLAGIAYGLVQDHPALTGAGTVGLFMTLFLGISLSAPIRLRKLMIYIITGALGFLFWIFLRTYLNNEPWEGFGERNVRTFAGLFLTVFTLIGLYSVFEGMIHRAEVLIHCTEEVTAKCSKVIINRGRANVCWKFTYDGREYMATESYPHISMLPFESGEYTIKTDPADPELVLWEENVPQGKIEWAGFIFVAAGILFGVLLHFAVR